MSIKGRLAKLEGDGGSSAACEVCGIKPGGPVTFVVDEEASGQDLPEHCPVCGEITRFTLDLGDAPVRSRPEEEDAEDW
jgi:hypothetical protein